MHFNNVNQRCSTFYRAEILNEVCDNLKIEKIWEIKIFLENHLNLSDFCYLKKLKEALFSFRHFKKFRNLPTFVETHIFASDFLKPGKSRKLSCL